jgi:outer membrane cobalamin receptor
MSQLNYVLLVPLLFAAPGYAEEDTEELDNIIVTASRTTDQRSEIPNTTSVIQLDELEARNAVSVPDALQHLPGVHVVQPSGQGGVARVFVRGGDQNLTMILVNGIRMNDPNDSRGSAFDFSTVNLNDVGRIEVVRGPQSAVYGSGSLAGVINIITKDYADEFGGSVFAEAGSDDFLRASLDVGGPVGPGSFSLRVANKDDGEPIEGTTFESNSVTMRMSFGDRDAWDLRLFGNYSDSEGTAFPEDSGGSELAVIRETDARAAESLRFGVNGSLVLSEKWHLNFLATWYDHDSAYLSPGVAPGPRGAVPPNGGDSNLERYDAGIHAVVEISDALTATVGFDHYDEDGTSDGFVELFPGFELPSGFEFDRNVAGAFGEIHFKTGAGPILTASVRHDDSSGESAETTSRLGFLYAFNDGRTTVRANWGQGFSLPGFFALASPLVGNPDLVPETSESYSIT